LSGARSTRGRTGCNNLEYHDAGITLASRWLSARPLMRAAREPSGSIRSARLKSSMAALNWPCLLEVDPALLHQGVFPVCLQPGSPKQLLTSPARPYTQKLVQALPKWQLPNRRASYLRIRNSRIFSGVGNDGSLVSHGTNSRSPRSLVDRPKLRPASTWLGVLLRSGQNCRNTTDGIGWLIQDLARLAH